MFSRMAKTGTLKILIVDDSPSLRQTVRQMWSSTDTVTLEAASGEEAVLRYAESRPDWVIMDLTMPGMGGLRATEAIRRLDPHARIIAMSQCTEPDDTAAAERAGALRFVNKEDLQQLSRIIRAR